MNSRSILTSLTAAAVFAVAAPSEAGGPSGRWTCRDAADAPLLKLTISLGSGADATRMHGYESAAIDPPANGEVDLLTGAGGLEWAEGYYKPHGGPFEALGLLGWNQSNDIVFAKGHSVFMSCSRGG